VGADYGFLQANSGAATGIEWNSGVWTAYTPTVTANSGSITTVTASGAYMRIGKTCIVRQIWQITTNGTGAGSVNLTLPFTATSSAVQAGVGREYASTGNQLQIEINASDTVAKYRLYNNLYPGGNSYSGVGSFVYEVA
jgi:hypothetical protein